jgi:Rrf2 family transcriptional regulator, iron-sulfur cluster assembly transcription factor
MLTILVKVYKKSKRLATMIRINRQTDYAIRVILALAKQGDEALLPTSRIQQEMLIPKALSLRVVADLARGGFILTYPGREGGLKLARPAGKINLRQVVTFFENNFTVSDCLHGGGTCPFDLSCPVRCRWARLQVLILQELENTTFDELAQEALSITDVVPLRVEQVGT